MVALLGLASWSLGYRQGFVGLGTPDAADYAQMARELAEGRGLRSLQSFPFVLAWLAEHGIATEPPWPVVTRYPLPILTRAASFRLVGAHDLGAVLPGALFLAATGVLVLLLGERLFGRAAGVAASVVYVASPAARGFALSGLTETGAALLVTAVALALSRAGESRRPLAAAALLGFLLGLVLLQRLNLAVVAPLAGILLWLGPERRGLAPSLVAALAALAVVGPWLAYCAWHFGSPLVQLTSDRALLEGALGEDPFLSFDQLDTWSVVARHPEVFVRALHPAWLGEHWSELFGTGLAWVGPLLLAGGLVPCAPRIRTMWLLALLGLVVLFVSVGGLYPDKMRFYFPWTPLGVVLAVGSAFRLLRFLTSGRRLVAAAAAVLVSAIALAPLLAATLRPPAPTLRPDRLSEAVRANVGPGGVVASDASWRIAWQGARPSLRFLGEAGQLEELDRRHYVRVAAVALQAPAAARFRTGLAKSPLAGTFREAVRVPNGATLWLRRGEGDW